MTETPYNISYVCFDCKKSFKRIFVPLKKTMKCPNCGKLSHNVGRKFKCPKRTDDKGWKLTKFLFDNGFNFQSVFEKGSLGGQKISYPKTIEEAKIFVKKYR